MIASTVNHLAIREGTRPSERTHAGGLVPSVVAKDKMSRDLSIVAKATTISHIICLLIKMLCDFDQLLPICFVDLVVIVYRYFATTLQW